MNRIKVGIMSYAMDNRSAKGTALYARKLIEYFISTQPDLDITLIHYDKVDDHLYTQVREIIMPKFSFPVGSHLIRQLLFFWKYRNENFDVIHWCQPRLYPFFWLAPSKKIVCTMHGGGMMSVKTEKFYLSNYIFNKTIQFFHEKIDKIIASSQYGKDEIIEYYNIPGFNIEIVYHGGNEDYKIKDKTGAKLRIEKKYNINFPFFLNVSRLTPHKNVDTLINAFNLYRSQNARNEHLVIVGKPHLGYEKTYELARISPYSGDIHFIDYVDNEYLNDIYSASEIFIFTSINEGFGLPIVEAMSCGIPVISSNATSLPEIGGDGVYTVDPLSIQEIANAMEHIMSDENLKERLISNAKIQAEKFTWLRTANETCKLYKKMLSDETI